MSKVTLDDLAVMIKEGFDAVDGRFEQVDKRFEQVDKRFKSVDKRFVSIDERFEKQEKLMHQLHNQAMIEIKSVEQHLLHRINNVDIKLKQIENMLTQDIEVAYIDIAYLKKEVLDIRKQMLELQK